MNTSPNLDWTRFLLIALVITGVTAAVAYAPAWSFYIQVGERSGLLIRGGAAEQADTAVVSRPEAPAFRTGLCAVQVPTRLDARQEVQHVQR